MDAKICVIGGGPAGAVIARRLVQLGHDVCLLERAIFPRPHIGESLPPGILPLFDTLGLRLRMENAGFLRPGPAMVRWSGIAQRVNHESGVPGFQVDRGRFDGLLLQAAAEVGVRVIQPATALRPLRTVTKGWSIPVKYADKTGYIHARFLVDATGQRSLLRERKIRLSASTIALYAYWCDTGLEGSETRVEAGHREWFWGAPLPENLFNATVFLDPKRCATSGRRGLESLYRGLLANSVLLRECLRGQLARPVQACDASSYIIEPSIDEESIKVGEASFSLDPLSSQGVQMALWTGIQGAIAVHTILTQPENSSAAIEFYQTRQRECALTHQRLAAGFYAEQTKRRNGDFWIRRAELLGHVTQAESWTPNVSMLTAEQRVCLSTAARLVSMPIINGDFVSRHHALMHPALDRPVAFVCGVAIAPLVALVQQELTAGEILTIWATQVALRDSVEILRWMWSKGILVRAPAP